MAAIERKRELVSIRFLPSAPIEPERLARFVAGQRGAQFTPQGVLKFSMKTDGAADTLSRLRDVLLDLAGSQQPSAIG